MTNSKKEYGTTYGSADHRDPARMAIPVSPPGDGWEFKAAITVDGRILWFWEKEVNKMNKIPNELLRNQRIEIENIIRDIKTEIGDLADCQYGMHQLGNLLMKVQSEESDGSVSKEQWEKFNQFLQVSRELASLIIRLQKLDI